PGALCAAVVGALLGSVVAVADHGSRPRGRPPPHLRRDLDRAAMAGGRCRRRLAGVTVVQPDGRRLLRIEARNAQTPVERKPPWIKVRAAMGPAYTELRGLVSREGLHTVCQEAGCPNIYECWEDREATFLIGGDQCTRRCDFCQIDTGKPAGFDADEPRRVGESVATMG